MKLRRSQFGMMVFFIVLGALVYASTLGAADRGDVIKAVSSGKIKEVNELLGKGSDVNEKDAEFGVTPLHAAAYHGHMDIVKLLLKKKADIHARDNDGETPLLAALSKGFSEIGLLLINRGAKVNVQTKKKWTPLHFAATLGDEDLILLLVKKGANKKARTSEGKTPLDLAMASGHKDLEAHLK